MANKKQPKRKASSNNELTNESEENAIDTWLPIGLCLGVTFGCCFSVTSDGKWDYFIYFVLGGLLLGIIMATANNAQKEKTKKTKKTKK